MEKLVRQFYNPKRPEGGGVSVSQYKAVVYFKAEAEFWVEKAKKKAKP
jgi:hypothetical protein